jgi:tripartite-type tricarboxylate transporter receptor subunit TctC
LQQVRQPSRSPRIASISRVPFLMVVNLAVPAQEIPEFVAYAKANPYKVNMAICRPVTELSF